MLFTLSTNKISNKANLLPHLILPGGFNTDVIGAASNFLKGPAMEFPLIPQAHASEASSGPIGPSSPGYVQGTANTVKELGPSTTANQSAYQSAVSNSSSAPTNNSNNQNGVPYAPTFAGQTIEINGNTYRSNASGGWDLVNSAGSDETNRLIEEAFGQSNSYLNQAEDALRKDYPTILSEIEQQRATGERLATSGKESTLGTIGEQDRLATQRNQSVTADARRLYDELRRGYGQRFGGSSSAGQAATELGNLEQQRQQGKIQQDFGNTMRQIETARTQTEKAYQEQLMQLEQTKQQAVNEANRDFQAKLLQISQSRAETEQAKAQAKLAALQDLRNKVYQINLQNLQFQQTLQAQKQQSDLGLSQYSELLTGFDTQATNATSGFTPTVNSNLQVGDVQGAQTSNPYLGQITNQPNKRDDFLSNLGFSMYQ